MRNSFATSSAAVAVRFADVPVVEVVYPFTPGSGAR
jgi:hypothetical protein